jgi:hypothetical protein
MGNLPGTETRIDQDAATPGGYQSTITPTSAAENRQVKHFFPSIAGVADCQARLTKNPKQLCF